MEQIWTEMYQAAKEILKPRDVSKRIEAGGVAGAVESGSGKIYVGVCGASHSRDTNVSPVCSRPSGMSSWPLLPRCAPSAAGSCTGWTP